MNSTSPPQMEAGDAPAPSPAGIGLHEPRGTITPHLLMLLVQLVSLGGPRFRGRKTLTVAAIVGLSAACHVNQFTTNLGLANLFALAWPHYLLTLAHFCRSSPEGPEGDLWHLDHRPKEALSFPALSWRKLSWAVSILVNLRGIRWTFEVGHVPRRVKQGEKEDRGRFLLLQLVDLGWLILMVDLVSQLSSRLFFLDPATSQPYISSKHLSLASPRWQWSLAKAFLYGAGPYFFINIQYVVCSIIGVALGLNGPGDWPPLFGKLKEATTVRKFWNRFWHQMIRKGLTNISTGLADTSGMKKGTTLHSYTHLWTAFAVSGLFHAGSMLILPAPANITTEERTVGILMFFLHQALSITLEDFVQWVWKKVAGDSAKPGRWATVLGYIWVVCSFWSALPLAGAVMLRLRMGQDAPLPFSFAKPLVDLIPLGV